MDVVADLNAYPEVLWTFYRAEPILAPSLLNQLEVGLNRARVNLYAGIDCNLFFPRLLDRWSAQHPQLSPAAQPQSNPVLVSSTLSHKLHDRIGDQIIIEGNDEDIPPHVEILVGRERELNQLSQTRAKVVFVTGIGGQGKSSLAATYFSSCKVGRQYSFYVWRDCKEESERFENQLASVIEQLSGGRISGEDLAKQSSAAIVEILIPLLEERKVLFVFDNVDHYVELETARLTGTPDVFVEALLKSSSDSRALFTCRPEVKYHSAASLNLHLEGINLEAAVNLFVQRSASSTRPEIQRAHALTDGHAFWLDLLAIQAGKQHSPIDLATLVPQVGSGTQLAEKTLNSIWETLRDREQIVLRAMAVTIRPSTEAEIADYVGERMNYNKVVRSLKNLRTLNLIVIKERQHAADLLELHPLVKQFVVQNFPEPERVNLLNRVIRVYHKFMGVNKKQLEYRPTLLFMQNWTQSAELDVAAGRLEDAFVALSDVAAAFNGSAYPREFIRAAALIFGSFDWVADFAKFRNFDRVFGVYLHLLNDIGQYQQADAALEKYELTVPNRDARYIHYCDMRCYSRWVRGDYATAVKWGNTGQNLKMSSGVDTKYDVSHNLALAERDAGRPEIALTIFLQGMRLADVIDPEKIEENRTGEYYGNVGRCLHLMGQIDSALACYQKSALLLEKARVQRAINQGFIRAWVAELLVARQQITLAYIFYRAAYLKWQQAAPPRATMVKQTMRQFRDRVSSSTNVDDLRVEAAWTDWMLGEDIDAKFR